MLKVPGLGIHEGSLALGGLKGPRVQRNITFQREDQKVLGLEGEALGKERCKIIPEVFVSKQMFRHKTLVMLEGAYQGGEDTVSWNLIVK